MLKDALRIQLTFVDGSLQMNLEGVSHELSLRCAGEGGNSINWVLGHMLNTRGALLELLGGEALTGERHQSLYGRHSQNVGPGDDCESLEALRETWKATQTALLEKLAAADDALLATMVPGLFEPESQEATGVQLASLVFHEAYHAGQIGVIRRNVGMEAAIS